VVSVPSSQFAERSGLWTIEEPTVERLSEREADVILETADLSGKDRRWRFLDVETGVPFTARMRDQEFEQSLFNGDINERLRVGIKMRITIIFKEVRERGEWKPVQSSIEVAKVELQ
jgi:hypothetical protein